ncbi:MAG TPA: OsmC family protein [Phototrophicaceae bacterium]|nr:OsmC family protein [Phototrophicaceae bacterium]
MGKITTFYKGGMLFETQMGSHTLQIDVPASMGGSDRGPTPPEIFIASLGSCVGAFVAQYCERNGVDARDLTVDVLFDKAENPSRLINLKIQVKLPDADCTEQRAEAVKRVAAHCPVHETISTLEGIQIEILDRTEREPAS